CKNSDMNWLTTYNKAFTVGGKADNLFRLKAAGFRVPAFGVVPLEFFDALKQLSPNEQSEKWDLLIGEIRADFPGIKYVAVRSSAVGEDGSTHSFAGQFESFLFVRPDQLEEHIRRVHASAVTERVEKYADHAGMQATSGVAVIVQQMIDADVSGVAFGMN